MGPGARNRIVCYLARIGLPAAIFGDAREGGFDAASCNAVIVSHDALQPVECLKQVIDGLHCPITPARPVCHSVEAFSGIKEREDGYLTRRRIATRAGQ